MILHLKPVGLTAIEAAFALADSGKFSSAKEIKDHLQRKGYNANLELNGRALARQLKERIARARAGSAGSDQ